MTSLWHRQGGNACLILIRPSSRWTEFTNCSRTMQQISCSLIMRIRFLQTHSAGAPISAIVHKLTTMNRVGSDLGRVLTCVALCGGVMSCTIELELCLDACHRFFLVSKYKFIFRPWPFHQYLVDSLYLVVSMIWHNKVSKHFGNCGWYSLSLNRTWCFRLILNSWNWLDGTFTVKGN